MYLFFMSCVDKKGNYLANRNAKLFAGDGINSNFVSPKNGPVAEWLGRALQKLVQRFESARDLGKRTGPKKESRFYFMNSSIKVRSTELF